MKHYCTYLRVSTQKQGKTMLGIEAQRKMCQDFVNQNKGNIKHEFMDIESGTHRDRKGLQDAIMVLYERIKFFGYVMIRFLLYQWIYIPESY